MWIKAAPMTFPSTEALLLVPSLALAFIWEETEESSMTIPVRAE